MLSLLGSAPAPILVHASERRSLRRAVRVDCEVIRERDARVLDTCSLDLSPDGMLVRANAKVLTGERVLVTFRVPGSGRWLDAEAIVARVVHSRRPGDTGRCLGLAFERLEDGERRVLRGALYGLPPPLPARAPRIDYAASAHLAALS